MFLLTHVLHYVLLGLGFLIFNPLDLVLDGTADCGQVLLMEAHKILDLIQLLIFFAQLLEQHPAVDLLL